MTINPVSTGKTQIIVSGGGRQTTVEVTVLMNGYKTLPQVAAGEGFTVALDKDGKVYTWGKNDLGQLGDQGKENRIVPTEITFDFGNPSNYITRIETGNGHTIAVDNTGKVWTWGRNDLGQLGNGTRNNSNKPVQVNLPDSTKAVEIGVGETTSYALDKDGHIYAWGNINNNTGYGNKPIQLDLFERMTNGEFADGAKVLRAKIDMASPNLNMRDPIIYRILRAHHHRTGDKWVVYPMYDFAHPISDTVEGVTHSLCSLEFEDHRPLYDWVLKEVGYESPSRQIEFARMNLNYTLTSKRRCLKLVRENIVSGWDDPRMSTLCGMRRRGYTPEAIRDFCERIGVSKANSVVDFAFLLRNRCPLHFGLRLV